MSEIVKLIPPKPRGESLLELKQALQMIGFHSEGLNISTPEQGIFDQLTVPFIASMGGHFIVVDTIGPNWLGVFDGLGRRKMAARAHFLSKWDGNALVVNRSNTKELLPSFLKRNIDRNPVIQFDRLYIDIGDVGAETEESVDFIFKIRNRGKKELIINQIVTDCQCTVAEAPEDPIRPGESKQILVRYQVDAARGPFERRLLLLSNDPVRPLVEMFVAGNTVQELLFSHGRVDLGEAVKGDVIIKRIFIRYTGSKLLELSNAVSDVDGLSIKMSRLDKVQQMDEVLSLANRYPQMVFPERFVDASNTFVVDLHFSAIGHDVAELNGKIIIETNLQNSRNIELPMSVRVVEPIASFPSFLFLGEFKSMGTASIDTTMTLISRNSEEYAIESVQIDGILLKSEFTDDPSDILKVRFYGTAQIAGNSSSSSVKIRLKPATHGRPPVALDLPIWYLKSESWEKK